MRMIWARATAVACAAGLLAAAGVGWATTPPSSPIQTITLGQQGRLSGQEARDHAIYEAAMRDFERSGFAGLNDHLPKLNQALDRAPASYPAVQQGRDRLIVRATDPADGMMLSLLAGSMASTDGRDRTVVVQPNVYPVIALMLGSAAVEQQDYERAITILDRGLALQPNDRFLMAERISALHGMGRWEAALEAADAALASNDLLILTDSGRFHRRRGLSLTELGRLDEAQAAYEAALEENPEDAAAKQELDYVRGLRAGRPSTEVQIVAPSAPAAPVPAE